MMFEIGDKIVSEELFEARFACDVSRCRGACCVEGDEGAPLLEEEVSLLKTLIPGIMTYLPKESQDQLHKIGFSVTGHEGNPVTTLREDGACIFAVRERNGIIRCGIEKAWEAGCISFQKPLSCHLYPVRLKRSGSYTLVNYHRWDICAPACEKGCRTGMPLFRFLKEPLKRAFGAEFYTALEEAYTYYLEHR